MGKQIGIAASAVAFIVVTAQVALAQIPITSGGATVDFSSFTGAGFSSAPAAGEFDSDFVAITGASDGNLAFGATQNTANTDYTRGLSVGNVATGGIYAFQVAPGLVAIGWQPTGADLTPGTFTFRFQNTSGGQLNIAGVRYTFYVYNNGDRSQSVGFGTSTDDATYVDLPGVFTFSPFVQDPAPVTWVGTDFFADIADVNLPNSGFFYARFVTDVWPGGSNGTDEIALTNIEVVLAGCGDGVVSSEQCDDANLIDGDGCSQSCVQEAGWTCSGAPSTCTPQCGDGLLVGSEGCDDGGTAIGDGCSNTCSVEPGYVCGGVPSVCSADCGDGVIIAPEVCDDGNLNVDDGCDDSCQLETGWTCSGTPSTCDGICADSLVLGNEGCDDGGIIAGDGCDAACAVEFGWVCVGEPSVCSIECGDGAMTAPETCDDGNLANGDGCDDACTPEAGWTCSGTLPTVCDPDCGDGVELGSETCDDANTAAGDGCSDNCAVEPGWACAGSPDVCTTNCGDGAVGGVEVCDDGNNTDGDGCTAECDTEEGFTCAGDPSLCAATCGDGLLVGDEDCDDGDTDAGDGCNAVCVTEQNFVCSGEPSACTADSDDDGFGDSVDNCPDFPNTSLADSDRDGIGDDCDVDDGSGGCCGTGRGNSGTTALVYLLAALAINHLRRRRRTVPNSRCK